MGKIKSVSIGFLFWSLLFSRSGLAGGNTWPLNVLPYAGQTQSTSSASCVSLAQRLYATMGTYFPGLPSSSDLTRLDVLMPTVQSTNAFTPLSTGSYQTSYYSQNSTYINSSQTVTLLQILAPPISASVLPMNLGVFTAGAFQLSSSILSVSGFASSCDSTKLTMTGDESNLSIAQGFGASQTTGSISCSIGWGGSGSVATICSDTSQTLVGLINGLTVNGSGGAFSYSCQDYDSDANASDSIGFRSSLVSQMSSADLSAFCAFFQ